MPRPREFVKKSEARILVYLSVAEEPLKHAEAIDRKLQIDYSYTIRLLREMYEKGWLTPHKYDYKTFYTLTDKAPLKKATELNSAQQLLLRT